MIQQQPMSSEYISQQSVERRVLILESDVLYATIIGEMLREGMVSSCEVTLTHSLEDGLEALAEASVPFDVTLLDLGFSDDNGDDLIQALHAINSTTPIIAITAGETESTARDILQAGAQDYLVKGQFKVQTLIRTINYAIERQKLRSELAESLHHKLESVERGFRRLISENADGIVVVRPNGTIRFANPQAEIFLEKSATDLLGEKVHFPFTIENAIEFEFTKGTGQNLTAELRSVAIEWEEEPAYLLSIRDITARKEQERALRTVADSLRQQNEDLDAYARMVAHDLKSPLGIIVGYAEALQGDIDHLSKDALSTYLDTIAKGGRKLESIINELLLLASVRQEKVDIQPIFTGPIIAEVRERLRHEIRASGAVIESPESWPTVWGYKPWIEEVWVNFISNAIKYGGNPPEICLGADFESDQMIRFWVKDNGQGLSAEDQSKLFKQFPKLSQVRAEGHGLGLSIVRRIVTRLGGQVGVKGEVGQGSTFFFTLPLIESEQKGRPERRNLVNRQR